MEAPRINTVSPAMVAVVGPRRGPSERVRDALAQVEANVCVIQTMRQLRSVCRESEPDLVVLEVVELSAERLNAEIDLLRGAGIQTPIFIVSNGILPGGQPVVITDVVDFATAQATPTEIVARITRVLESMRRPPDPDPFGEPPTRTIDGVRIDWRAKQATYRRTTVGFTTPELRLLESFLENRRRHLSTGALLRAVWGENRHRSDGLVAVYVWALRGKLQRLSRSFGIENKPGSGYRLTIGAETPRRRKSNGPRNGPTRRSA